MSGMVVKKDGKLVPRKRPQSRNPLPMVAVLPALFFPCLAAR